jgi:hypothetical protein
MTKTILLLLLLALSFATASARTIEVTTSGAINSLRVAAQTVQPGDTILFRGGIYPGGELIANLRGTPGAWITVMAAVGEDVILRGGGNSWQLTDPAYLRIEGFTIREQTGNGMNIDDAGTYDTPAHHIVIANCTFERLEATGNNDQLKMSGVDTFEVRDCHFSDGSPGGSMIDMVGCHMGRFIGNRFERTGSNAIQAKGATRYIRIERNRFDGGAEFSRMLNIGGSTGLTFFRPLDAKYEASDIEVSANIITGSDAPIAFVGAVNCAVVNNTIWLPNRWAIRILQETTEPGFLECGDNAFAGNIVVVDNRAANPTINIGPNTRPNTFAFEDNLWYNLENANWSGPNTPTAENDRILNRDPMLVDPPRNMTPRPGSPAIAAADHRVELDFYGSAFQTPSTIGAIEGGSISAVELPSVTDWHVRITRDRIAVDGATMLQLFDPRGRLVGTGADLIDVASISGGTYFLIVERDGARTVRPVVLP